MPAVKRPNSPLGRDQINNSTYRSDTISTFTFFILLLPHCLKKKPIEPRLIVRNIKHPDRVSYLLDLTQ